MSKFLPTGVFLLFGFAVASCASVPATTVPDAVGTGAATGSYQLLGFDVGAQARPCSGKISVRGTVTLDGNTVIGLRASGVGLAASPGNPDLAKGALVLEHSALGTFRYTFNHIAVIGTDGLLLNLENGEALQELEVAEGTPPRVRFVDRVNGIAFAFTDLAGTVKVTDLANCQ